MDELYNNILLYAQGEGLENVEKALNYVKRKMIEQNIDVEMADEYYIHGLSMAWMLVELQLPISSLGMDIILSASICHVLAEAIPGFEMQKRLLNRGIDREVIEFAIKINTADEQMIRENRLLFIAKLAERSNLIEHLCDMDTEEAKNFIHETKRVFFPMCIYGKENYPEIEGQISVLMEKMRSLIQVMDILFAKYDAEEDSLYDEILNLKEENSRIREALKYRRTSH